MLDLRWHGPVFGQSGYEVLTRGLILALDQMGVKIQLHPAWSWNMERISLPFNVVNRIQRMIKTRVREQAPIVMHQRMWDETNAYPASRFIYSLFETDQVPSPWRDGFMKSNGIFVFSEWNRKTWADDGIPEGLLTNVGAGIDWERFDPEKVKPANIVNTKGYVFLSNGDFTERKNFDVLIEAYCKAFKPSDDVTLIIKSHMNGFIKANKDALYEQIKVRANRWGGRHPRILLCADKLAEEEIPSLYASAHCFVLPSRGEGLCIPVMEAMASGLPVITTGWGGQRDFIKDGETGKLLPYKLELIRDVSYIQKCPHACAHSWAEVHVDDLIKAMRWAFDNRNEAAEMGAKARESLKNRHWHHAALNMLKTIYQPIAKVASDADKIKTFKKGALLTAQGESK